MFNSYQKLLSSVPAFAQDPAGSTYSLVQISEQWNKTTVFQSNKKRKLQDEIVEYLMTSLLRSVIHFHQFSVTTRKRKPQWMSRLRSCLFELRYQWRETSTKPQGKKGKYAALQLAPCFLSPGTFPGAFFKYTGEFLELKDNNGYISNIYEYWKREALQMSNVETATVWTWAQQMQIAHVLGS